MILWCKHVWNISRCNNITELNRCLFFMIALHYILSVFFQNETMPTTDEAMYYTPTSVHDLNVTPHRFINSSSRRFATPPRNVLVTSSEYPFVTPPRFTESVNRSSVTLVLFTDTDDHSSQTPTKLAKYTNDSFSTPPRSRHTDDYSLVTLKLFTDNLDESYLSPSRFTGCVNHPFVTPPRSTDFSDSPFVNLALTRESDNHSFTPSPTFIHTIFVTPRKSRHTIFSDSMITPLRATNHVRHSALTPSPSLDSMSYSRPARRRRLSFSNSEISPARTDVSAKRPSSVKDMQNERHVCRAKRNKTAFSDKQVSYIATFFYLYYQLYLFQYFN